MAFTWNVTKSLILFQKNSDFADFSNNENAKSSTESDAKGGLRSSNSSTITSPTSSILRVCFVCDKENRKHKGTRLILSTKDLEASILHIVLTLDDNVLITKLEIDKERWMICDFVAKKVMCHSMCRVG